VPLFEEVQRGRGVRGEGVEAVAESSRRLLRSGWLTSWMCVCLLRSPLRLRSVGLLSRCVRLRAAEVDVFVMPAAVGCVCAAVERWMRLDPGSAECTGGVV